MLGAFPKRRFSLPTDEQPNTLDAAAKKRTPANKKPQAKGKWLYLFQKRMGTFLTAAIVAILTVFSNSLTERIKFSLDRADLRQAKFAKLSQDLSIYLFDCEGS
jgi:hypothetical protein